MITHLEDRHWFRAEQPTLLHLLNGENARDVRQLLHVDLNIPLSIPIVGMAKQQVTARIGDHQWVSDFRVGQKWGNVLRNPDILAEYKKLAAHEEQKAWRWKRYLAWRRNLYVPVGGGQDTFFPDPDSEGTPSTFDGRVRYSDGNGQTWATMRGQATGTQSNQDGTSIHVSIRADNIINGNDWESFWRGIILFDTGGTINGNSVDSATQGFVVFQITDNYSGGISLVTSSPASDTAIADGDFDQVGTTLQATDILWSAMTVDNSTYNDFTLNATGRGNIATTSGSPITRFGYRELHDAADNEPTAVVNTDSETTSLHSADRSGTGTDVRLIVTHSAAGGAGVRNPFGGPVVLRNPLGA